ncbi:peptide deformylase [Flaviflexus huanghaiensis]|uniref:peptide deformylase n=1 Tax=Flaviflexus huanghaiensis TaxID=1111473 RepID=UPI0015FAAB41|nr:peptide deformylase [Flaviflexus huanghaiensis]
MIRPIVITGDPVLHSPADPVTDFDRSLADLVADMFETTVAAPGVGLAAPQIGIGLQIFVWVYGDQDVAPPRGVAINPKLFIEPIQPGEPTSTDREGCLSFPDEKFALRRSPRAILRARDATGEPYVLEATGWFARILQHEYDHLQGTLYVDRLIGEDAETVSRITKERSWGRPGLSWTP